MLPLLLALSLAQVAEPPPDAAAPTPDEATSEAPPGEVPPVELLPAASSTGDDTALPPDAQPRKQAPPEHSVGKRVLLAGGAGVAASFAGLGLSLALTGSNPGLDTSFATAMLAPILITGVGFAVHQSLGGRGEPILAFAVALAVMAGAWGLSTAIDSTSPSRPLLTTLIGTLPAAAGAILVLELTTRKSKRAPHFALHPTGFSGVF